MYAFLNSLTGEDLEYKEFAARKRWKNIIAAMQERLKYSDVYNVFFLMRRTDKYLIFRDFTVLCIN